MVETGYMARARSLLEGCWWAGVRQVQGRASVARVLRAAGALEADCILAVGKAAASMYRGAVEVLGAGVPALVVTRYGYAGGLVNTDSLEVLESAHPVPDENSLRAGARCLEYVRGIPPHGKLLMLVSGGASALVEALPDGMSLDTLRTVTQCMLAEGFGIDAINAVRCRLSQVKGGRLLARFGGTRVTTYALSDVPGDEVAVIGSGIGGIGPDAVLDFALPEPVKAVLDSHERVEPVVSARLRRGWKGQIIASNRMARAAAARYAMERGYRVSANQQMLGGDVSQSCAAVMATVQSGGRGVYLFGGEPTVILPPNPGIGGRNQQLALLMAREIAGQRGVTLLVAGTDGADGVSEAAGAIVDGATWGRCPNPDAALATANADPVLEAAGARWVTGPTDTNVMDLVIALKD